LNTPDTLYDFVTVVLHEMAHGLGFTGFFFVEELLGVYGYYDYGDAATFDLLVTRSNGDQLLDVTKFPNQSETLRNALISNALYNSSPVAITDNGGARPRLYAPTIWDAGSSIYHLNDATYPNTNPNSLMTHAIGKAEAVHDPRTNNNRNNGRFRAGNIYILILKGLRMLKRCNHLRLKLEFKVNLTLIPINFLLFIQPIIFSRPIQLI
jgi:hypothetical protein